MKVQVYADTFNSNNDSTLVWGGELECIPRQGDIIFVVDGWGGARVTRVYWDLNEGNVELHIDDHNEAYKGEFAKAGRSLEVTDAPDAQRDEIVQ